MNYIAKCGCSVEVIDEANGTAIILHCSKHEAAEDMYEALKEVAPYIGCDVRLKIAKKALAKAEGK